MQANIHPNYNSVNVNCTGCGNKFKVMSTIKDNVIHIETCSLCHPAYTGKKRVTVAGKAEKFNKKFGAFTGIVRKSK